jgi:hypothetical protein
VGAQALVAEASGNPYLAIAGSNVFRLKAPEPIRVELPPTPLARAKVAGITTFPADKLALLKVYLPAIPPEPAKEVSCILTVGQRQGPIEVVEIDEAAGSVKVNNSGTVQVLTLDKDSPRPQNPSPPTAPPSFPLQPVLRR